MTSASKKKFAPLALLAALSVPGLPASAGQAEPYLTEYLAYDAALQAGNNEAAAAHGLAAWEAADEALGDHRLTGILAYNYGRLIVLDATQEAAVPLRRASALQQAGLVELPPDALRLYLAYAEFAMSGFEEKSGDQLREALDAVGLSDESLIQHVATMWINLVSADFMRKEYRKAERDAARAEAAIMEADPDARRDLARVILLGTVASLGRAPWSIRDIEDANEQFDRARRLFPPQRDLASFDPLLAQAMAWRRASWRELQKAIGWATPNLDYDDSPPTPPVFQYQADGSLKCDDFEWQEKPLPRYPAGAWHGFHLGVVVVGYRLGEDLRVRDAQILAEVPPREEFGEVSLPALSGWRAQALPTGGAECSYVEFIDFAIEWRLSSRGRTQTPSITSSTP